MTFYRAEEKRGAIPLDLEGGVVVHDGFIPYGALGEVAHALCNAHHLRELKALIELDGEAWATPMRDTLLDANAAVRKARQAGAAALAPDQVEAFEERYWAAVREGLAFHRALPARPRDPRSRGRVKHRPGFNLLARLKTFKDDALRFLVDFDVPFTNNLAEQDVRMTKVKMKISGAFRTWAGAKDFALLRSIVSTARKQRYEILQTLAATPQTVANALLA
jgi:transposase